MLKCNDKDGKKTFILDNGDYGIGVAIKIQNFEFLEGDTLIFTIRRRNLDREVILQKEFSEFNENSVLLLITEQDAELLKEAIYSYELEIYRNGSFLLTITQNQDFIVEGGY